MSSLTFCLFFFIFHSLLSALTFSCIAKKLRVNQQIRAQTVRVIGDEAQPLGIMSLEKAFELARQKELDLVEVAPQAAPPVCKLMDYGKYLYRQQKADRKHRAQQKHSEVKGIRLGFKTGQHDIEVKAKQARKFLEARNLVKVTMILRGREITHRNLGIEKMQMFYELVKDAGKLEERPKSQGNSLFMIISPVSNAPASQTAPTESASSSQSS